MNSLSAIRFTITSSFLLVGISLQSAIAETVTVKYRGSVDLSVFDCESVSRSSFITRICYDQKNKYMIIKLDRTYYHYCEIDAATVGALKSAESMGRFFNSNVKGDGQTGPFDCRTRRIPVY